MIDAACPAQNSGRNVSPRIDAEKFWLKWNWPSPKKRVLRRRQALLAAGSGGLSCQIFESAAHVIKVSPPGEMGRQQNARHGLL
ncbi:MAG: hypothetical protein V4724_37860 [Pseudomonadota bacterium]